MAWLSGWNRRKLITVNGTTATQSNYQMKLTVNQSGTTDSGGVVSLGGNILSSFADLRFTKSDGTTTLNYWIESITGTSPNQVAKVWIKLAPSPDTIPASGTYNFYIYYNNPSSTPVSNGRNTFIVFDDFSTNSTEQWTKIDPDSGITIDRTTNHRVSFNNIWGKKDNRVYFNNTVNVGNFRYDFTSDMTSGNFITNYWVGFATVNSAIYPWHDNSIYLESYKPDSSSTDRLQLVTITNGSNTGVTAYYGVVNTIYYCSLIRIGSTAYLYVYSDYARTSLLGSTSLACSTANMIYIYALQTVSGGGGENQVTGFVKDIIIRNYTSPEPTWGTVGTEQLQPVTLNISSNPSTAEVWLASPTGSQWQDQFVQTSTTLYVTPGTSYDIEVGKGGYQPWTLINVCSGNCAPGSVYNIQANLTPQPGTLSISSTPSGARIYINGGDTGQTTTPAGTSISEPPSTYDIRLTLSGYYDWTGTGIIVTSNTTTNVSATFAGSAYISSDPTSASVYLDGILISGTTPLTITNLTTTTSGATAIHSYIVALTGYVDTSGSFTVTAGQTTTVPITFPGSLYITSIPTGVQIYIDGILQ